MEINNTLKLSVIFLLMLCITVSCKNKKVDSDSIPEYKVMTLDTTNTIVYSEYSAVIQSNKTIDIRSKVTGYLLKSAKEEGTQVKKGDLIFKIDDSDYRQKVNSSQAAMQSAQSDKDNSSLEVRKLTPLVEKGIISPYELETAKSNLEAANARFQQAKAEYENSLITLGYTEIRSPVEGVLGRIHISEGSLVSSNSTDALTTISSSGNIFAYFSFDEKKLSPIRKNELHSGLYKNEKKPVIELVLADGSLYDYKGWLVSASGLIDRTTGSIQLKVEFPNPNFSILSGSSGVLRFPANYKGCIQIPQSASYEMQDKVMVFVVNEDNTVSKKSVVVEGISGNNYVISGIKQGTKIVIEGVDKLKEGMKITPRDIN